MSRAEEFLRPGEPLGPADAAAVAEFDDGLRAIGASEEQVDHWVWEAAAGLLETPSIPRGFSEWVWACIPIVGVDRWIEVVAGVAERRRVGPDEFELYPMEILKPLALAWPDRSESLRRLLAFAGAMPQWDLAGAPALLREMEQTRAAVLVAAGVPMWVTRRPPKR